MSMPTKGKHHHLSHHHQQHHSQQQQQHQQQAHHNPPQHQHQLILNVNQPVVPHPPQTYSAVVTTNTPRFLPNAGEYTFFSRFVRQERERASCALRLSRFRTYYPQLPVAFIREFYRAKRDGFSLRFILSRLIIAARGYMNS